MFARLTVVLAAAMVALTACSEPPPPPEPEIPEKCKKIHIDRLAGDWTLVRGNAAKPEFRMRIQDAAGSYKVWFVNDAFEHLDLEVEKREKDLKLTGPLLPGADPATARRVRMYLEPSLKDCALKVNMGVLEGTKETVEVKTVEYLEMPQSEVVFSYQPADAKLFLGPAAKDKRVADKQVAEGGPKFDHPMGLVPVGFFSDVAADGDPACTYTFDLYFDGKRVPEMMDRPAGEVKDGVRSWYHDWDLPYSGNHHLQFYRYRACGGGERELIGVAAVSAILQ